VNAELLRQASEKVPNPNILVNLVSKRVRQLNAAGGTGSRPLIHEAAGMGVADIALAELVNDSMGWEQIEMAAPETGPAKRRRRVTR
jgi:DNA-directed RNA polymerase subunit omega